MEWLLPEADSPADAVVPVMDWCSAHLAEEVQDMVRLQAQSPVLYLGGAPHGCKPSAACGPTRSGHY